MSGACCSVPVPCAFARMHTRNWSVDRQHDVFCVWATRMSTPQRTEQESTFVFHYVEIGTSLESSPFEASISDVKTRNNAL